jgi:hypothetical protein
MADEPTSSGWLPPHAPGGEQAPRFEPAPPEPEPEPEPEPTAPSWSPPVGRPPADRPTADRPGFVRPRQVETNGLAVTALVLGIVGLSLTLISVGLLFIVTLPCSIAAWICAAQARTRINLGETTAGRGQAQAAYILGVLGVVLGVMAMVGWIAAIASGLDLDELRQDLERQSNPDAVEAMRALIGR